MWNPVLSSDAKYYLNKESIFYNPNFVTVYVNNEIPKALVFTALIPSWVYFLSIPAVSNPVLSSDAKCYLNTESMRNSGTIFSSI